MNHRESILLLCDLYCSISGRSGPRISTLIWNHGARLQRIAAGADLATRSYERAVQWLSDHWPSAAEWPPDIPRPTPAPDSPAAQAAAGPPPPGDADTNPVAAVKALADRVTDLMGGDPVDWDAVARTEQQKLTVALRLRADGQIASPSAVCLALGAPRYVYDDVVRRYHDSMNNRRRPRRGSQTERMLTALAGAGDIRFRSRWARAA